MEGLCDGHCCEGKVEVVMQGVLLTALAVLQPGMLLGVTVKEFDLEAALVVGQHLVCGKIRVGTKKDLGASDASVRAEFLYDVGHDLSPQRLDDERPAIYPSLGIRREKRQLRCVQVFGVDACAFSGVSALLPFLAGGGKVEQHPIVAQTRDQVQITLKGGVDKGFFGEISVHQ